MAANDRRIITARQLAVGDRILTKTATGESLSAPVSSLHPNRVHGPGQGAVPIIDVGLGGKDVQRFTPDQYITVERPAPADAERNYRRVAPTADELAQWAREHPGRPRPAVYRVECRECGRRLWGSGMGVGSHNRWHARQSAARGR